MEYINYQVTIMERAYKESLLNMFILPINFLRKEQVDIIRDMYFNTYSKNIKNWNLKRKPGMDWYIEEVRKLIQKKKGYGFDGQYDNSF